MDILATARQVWQNYFKTGASSYMVASLNLKEWPVADESDVLFQEIEDDLRQEQTNKLWTDYGKYIVGAALVLVIGVAGFQGWKNYDLEKRQVAGETFASVQHLIADKKSDEALKAFSAISAKGGGYAVLAKFRGAALMIESGDLAGAISTYQQIAKDENVNPYYKDMAVIVGSFAELDAKDGVSTLIDQTGALNNAISPWRHSAREVLGLSALKSGDKSKAAEYFKTITEDATAPKEIKVRAGEMLTIVSK